MIQARRIVGAVALLSYLAVGFALYTTVLPEAGWLWPPDFYLRGYNVTTIAPFVEALQFEARDIYARLLLGYDRVFIVSFAIWLVLMGWRGDAVRYVVIALALVYAGVDLAENVAIHRFVFLQILDPTTVNAASHLTSAKFASFYLCILVLIVHVRRTHAIHSGD